MMPKTAADVRAFLQNRATERPKAEAPAVAIDGAKATLRLFDPIDSWGEWWGMSAKEFAATLDALPSHVNTIELLINSPGGDVFDGMAMINVMRAHPARTVAIVQGIAASAASFIACAADETIMAPNSTLMIHDAWGVCIGNADEMLNMAAVLDKASENSAEIYASKSGATVDEMRAAMRAETWYTAEEAVAAKLADSIAQAEPEPDRAAARWSPDDLKALAALLAEQGTQIQPAPKQVEPTTEPVVTEAAARNFLAAFPTKETPHE